MTISRGNCSFMTQEGKNFSYNLEQAFMNKAKFEEGKDRIFKHMIKVTEDFEHFSRNYQANSFFLAGNSLGDILKIFVFGPDGVQAQSLFSAINFGQVDWKFTNCGGSDPLTVSNVFLDSAPAKSSQDGIKIVGKIAGHVELKNVNIETTVGGAHLNTDNLPVSDIYDDGQDFTYTYNVMVPGFAPSGHYAVKFDITDSSSARVSCTVVEFDL